MGFLGGSDGKESACNMRDPISIPGLERFPGKRNGNPLQYSCLENSMDSGAWQATVHGVAESDMTKRLSTAQHKRPTLHQASPGNLVLGINSKGNLLSG